MLLFSVKVAKEVFIFLPWYLFPSFNFHIFEPLTPVLTGYLLNELFRVNVTRLELRPSPHVKRMFFDPFVWISSDAQYQKALLIQII